MTRLPIIPTAINLLLIVALTVQPMVAYATAAGCGADGSTCQGCGCCEVENANDACGCCGGTPEPSQKRDCCVHESSGRTPVEGAAWTEVFDNQRPALAAGAGKVASSIPSSVLRSCSCEQQPQPLGNTASQRPSGESRQTIAVGCVAFDASSLGNVPANGAERRNADLPIPQHVVQVLLCIWRL